MRTPRVVTTPPADAAENAQSGAPIAHAPAGARARLVSLGADPIKSARLGAMGMSLDEVIVVHRTGEPTIISLGGWNGRRIGLSARAALGLRIAIEP